MNYFRTLPDSFLMFLQQFAVGVCWCLHQLKTLPFVRANGAPPAVLVFPRLYFPVASSQVSCSRSVKSAGSYCWRVATQTEYSKIPLIQRKYKQTFVYFAC